MTDLNTVNLGFTPGDVIVVTGAASGIGRRLMVRAAQMGLAVSGWDLNKEGVEEVLDEVTASGGRGLALQADVSDPEQVRAAMEETTRELGPVKHLANNAGPASAVPIEFDDAMRASVGGVRLVTDTWLDTRPGPGATMCATASVAGNVVGTASDWYCAAKAGIAGYIKHLAAYRSEEARYTAVAPGMVDTPRLGSFAESEVGQRVLDRIPVHRMGDPDELAWLILFLLSPLASYVNGECVVADGGWTITQ